MDYVIKFFVKKAQNYLIFTYSVVDTFRIPQDLSAFVLI